MVPAGLGMDRPEIRSKGYTNLLIGKQILVNHL